MDNPIILITNDDSLYAPGIKALIESVEGLGKIIVVAPDKPQSGMGHAITINQSVKIRRNKIVPQCNNICVVVEHPPIV